ncbi:hypothetical protein BpHYR1_053358 [Brachionus plicatilis]|uniref:Uncharacterized protein n=1 Tax=Brachionus plicatilis TaxID=10195 RepID=A0A3M7QVR2_BRAPC|nr:hypothetical protein BpHYR1_053358 [Brachionus plicatilis]
MDDYLSDESILTESDSDSIQLNQNDINSEFSVRNQNRQIETLKKLRHCLNENKQLRQRLEIVESELENYLEYKSFLPIVDRNDQSTCTEPKRTSPVEEIKEDTIVMETKECQADFEIHLPKMPTPLPPPSPIVIIKEKTAIFIPKSDNETQCDGDYWTDKELIEKLKSEIEAFKHEREQEQTNYEATITELKKQNEDLGNRLEDSQQAIDTANNKLEEYLKLNIKLDHELDELKFFKENYSLLKIENDELMKNLDQRQNDLEDANAKVIDLSKSLNESLELGEKLKLTIEQMEAKNKNSVEKFMDECLRLEKQNYDLKQNKESLEAELKSLAETMIMLQKEIDRYKSDLKNFNFKEFVSLRRELNQLKQEREKYFANLVTSPQTNQVSSNQQSSPLPPIKPLKKNVFEHTIVVFSCIFGIS